MNTRRINLTLWATTAALAALTVAVVVGGLFLPLDGVGLAGEDDRPGRGPAATRPAAAAAAGSRLPPLSEFEPAWAVRLRRPLAPTAGGAAVAGGTGAAPTRPPPPPPVAPPLTLVGTIGDAVAMLRGPDGSVQVRAVGETVAGATTVLAVRPSQVDVRHNGQVVTLHKAAEPEAADPFRPATGPSPDDGGASPPDGDPQPGSLPVPDPEPGPDGNPPPDPAVIGG